MTTPPDPSTPRPTALVAAAVAALLAEFFEPVDAAELFTDAWEGAAELLTAAGVRDIPPPPAYPQDLQAATTLHTQHFPALEALATASIGWEALAAAALDELALRRHDVHTLRYDAPALRFIQFLGAGALLDFGLVFSAAPPLRIVAVTPGSPAQRAGLHRGLEVLAVNDQPAARQFRMRANGLLDWQDGALSTVRVRRADGQVTEAALQPAAVPLVHQQVLTDTIGVVRLNSFPGGDAGKAVVQQLRVALEAFERRDVTGWVLDLRWNFGGNSDAVTNLFVNQGRLWRRQARVELVGRDGMPIPRIQEVEADGTALPFQRPLAMLVGPGTQSGPELCAGALQALGRATLVGEPTTGALGAGRIVALAPGWQLMLTGLEAFLGPDLWRRNRVGLTPDVLVIPTVADEVAGRDPQLDAAIRFLTERTASSVRT
jgi:C-terminal processing protease CtpA/Prc